MWQVKTTTVLNITEFKGSTDKCKKLPIGHLDLPIPE
jgi:hypothetical protein